MQINKTAPALYAMRKALEQPKMLLELLQGNFPTDQKLATPSGSAIAESDVVATTGKGQQINIIV